MGGGGGSTFYGRSPEQLAKLVKNAGDDSSIAAFEADLSTILSGLLGTYNGRDTQLVGERLKDVEAALKDAFEGSFDQLFGGSVAKHTFVDGLSDVDSLVIVDDSDLAEHTPARILEKMEKILTQNLPEDVAVRHGRMAVSVNYPDGMEIQLLPARRNEDGGLQVPSSRTEGWSHINPQGFQKALTDCNQKCGSKLVPTIKLAKAINGTLPDSQQLSGYHIESLAIKIFREYDGPKTTVAMLPTFFSKAKEFVLSPIKDSSGQSVHVDGYLGDANSQERVVASHVLGRLEKRMRNASASKSTAQWRALFGFDE
jgi:hypothetical protein